MFRLFKNILIFAIFVQIPLYSDTIGRGASFPFHVYADWIQAYNKETGNTIDYTATGSGDGILSVKNRAVDFGGSDKPLAPWRLKRYKLLMFPTIIGSIVLAYNIPGIDDGKLNLSEEAIVAIYSGSATHWDDPRIKKYNTTVNLPHELIHVVVRKKGSGTTYNFTYYLRRLDHKIFRKAKKLPKWQMTTMLGKGNSGMAEVVNNTPYSIGYLEFSYKKKYNLSVAKVQNRANKWISPSLSSSKEGVKYVNMSANRDFYGMVTYPEGEKSYPLIATSFILLPKENKEHNQEILLFFKWVFNHGEAYASKHGYAFLPKKLRKDIITYLEQNI